jgi:hypothetical protein
LQLSFINELHVQVFHFLDFFLFFEYFNMGQNCRYDNS